MAIFHLSTKTVSRSSGRSAVAAAAYRAGDLLTNERDGVTHDYRQRQGVEHSEIVMPDGGSADRSALWNAAEAAEKRKDARTAREWVLAIPAELVPKSQHDRELVTGSPDRELVREFAQELARRYGVAVDVAIHAPDREGDQRNHHAHLLVTTRQVTRVGGGVALGEKAAIELSDAKRKRLGLGSGAEEVTAVRTLWERCANRALEREGKRERIDARTLAAQGIERAATVHLGPAATAMERGGCGSDRGDQGRAQAAAAAERPRLVAEAAQIGVEVERIDRIERPRQIKQAWQRELADQRAAIAGRASRLEARTSAAHELQGRRVGNYAAMEPKPPSGLLAGFKRGAYEKAAQAWRGTMGPLRRRLGQLGQRLERLRGYLPGGEKGDALAERKAEKAQPELAARHREVMAAEKQAQAEIQRREVEQRRAQTLERYQQQRQRERGDRGRGGRGL